MKEVILKATDGTDVVLTIEDNPSYVYPRIEKIQYIPEEPNFQVGNWVYDQSTSRIFRVTGIYKTTLYGDNGIPQEGFCQDAMYCRLATPKEIETHLLKTAKEKGFVDGAKFRSTLSDNGQIRTIQGEPYSGGKDKGDVHVNTLRIEWEYLQLGCSNPRIYDDGKWAEIIPSKKKLPRTKEEFGDFLIEYYKTGKSTQNFLKDYED